MNKSEPMFLDFGSTFSDPDPNKKGYHMEHGGTVYTALCTAVYIGIGWEISPGLIIAPVIEL